jgi:RNA polymerase-binding protein DksA
MVAATDRPGEPARPRRTLAAVAKKAVAGVTASVAPAARKTAAPATKTAAPAKVAAVKTAPAKAAASKTAPAKEAATPAVKAAPVKAAPVKAAAAAEEPTTPVKAPAKAAPAKAAAVKAAPTRSSSRRKGPFELPPVREGEEPWTADELKELRVELDSQALELRGEIDEAEIAWHDLQRDSGEGSGDDQADAGSKTFDREHELSLANNSRDLLAQVDRALSRLDNGTYGVCENCGQPVGKARLQAFPRATLCVTCKQREERR